MKKINKNQSSKFFRIILKTWCIIILFIISFLTVSTGCKTVKKDEGKNKTANPAKGDDNKKGEEPESQPLNPLYGPISIIKN